MYYIFIYRKLIGGYKVKVKMCGRGSTSIYPSWFANVKFSSNFANISKHYHIASNQINFP